ncbi:hypothetical protein HDV57DRAFT_241647 [Trichoderma longibrachiatum]
MPCIYIVLPVSLLFPLLLPLGGIFRISTRASWVPNRQPPTSQPTCNSANSTQPALQVQASRSTAAPELRAAPLAKLQY